MTLDISVASLVEEGGGVNTKRCIVSWSLAATASMNEWMQQICTSHYESFIYQPRCMCAAQQRLKWTGCHLERKSPEVEVWSGTEQHGDFQPGNSCWLLAKTFIDPWLDCSSFALKYVCACLWVSHWKLRGNTLNPHFSPNLGRGSMSWLKTYYYTNTITMMTGEFAGLLMIHCVWNFEASQIFVLSILLASFDSISDISDLTWPCLVYRWTVEIWFSLKITVQPMCACWRLYVCCYVFKQM